MTRTDDVHIDGVLVIGGGYAGLHAARAARQRAVDVAVLSVSDRHDSVTRLAAVAGRTASRSGASRSIDDFGHRVIVGELDGIEDGSAHLGDGRILTAEAVVLATGSTPTRPDIDGIEHARHLRFATDAIELRTALESADAVTIVGGGATGVQLAGAIGASSIVDTVRIVEMEDRLLPSMTASSSEGAERILRDRGVDVRTGATVDEFTVDGVVVDGESLPGVAVWAGGFAPRTDGLDVPLADDGRVLVDEMLRVDGWQRTFAAGDVAAHTTRDGVALPMSAQIAVQAGESAGRNAARTVRGFDLEPVELSHRGWVLDLGGHRGIAEVGGVSLAAPFADLLPPLLHEAIDVKTLYGMGGLAGLFR